MRSQLLAIVLVLGCGAAAFGQRGATAPAPGSPQPISRAPRNAAEFDRTAHEPIREALFRDIADRGQRSDLEAPGLLRGLFGRGGVDVIHDDACPLAGQLERDCTADATARSGDQCHLAGQGSRVMVRAQSLYLGCSMHSRPFALVRHA